MRGENSDAAAERKQILAGAEDTLSSSRGMAKLLAGLGKGDTHSP